MNLERYGFARLSPLKFAQDTAETLDYYIDFGKLETEEGPDTLVSIEWSVLPDDDLIPLVISTSFAGTIATVRVSRGTTGSTYSLRAISTWASGLVRLTEVEIVISGPMLRFPLVLTGIPSSEFIGIPQLIFTVSMIGAISSQEAMGSPFLQLPIIPPGAVSAETFGLPFMFAGEFSKLFTGVLQSVQTDLGLTYGATMKQGGGATDVVTLAATSGTMTRNGAVPILVQGTGAGVVKVSYDGGATFPMTGVTPVAGTPIALTGTGAPPTMTITFGTIAAIALNQTWKATCAGLQDQSGNGLHYTQATAGFQPEIAVGNNGFCSIIFDGVDDYLQSNVALPSPSVTPYALTSVFRQITSASRRFFGTSNGSSGHIIQNATSPLLTQYHGSAGPVASLALNSWGANEAWFSNTTADYMRLGSGSPVSGVATGLNGFGATPTYIGCAALAVFANFELQSLTYSTGAVPATWRPMVALKYGGNVAVGQTLSPTGIASAGAVSQKPFVQGPMTAAQITILCGQSNAGGRDTSPGSFTPNTAGVAYYIPGGQVPFDNAHVFSVAGEFGPDLEMGNRLALTTPGGNAILAKYAVGGSYLNPTWWNGVNINNVLAALIASVKNLGPTHANLIFIQGESETADASYAPGAVQATYQAGLTSFAAGVRAAMPGITVRFFIVSINANWGTAAANYTAITAAQAAFVAADGNAELINLDDLDLIANIHYINGDQIIVGERIAGAIIKANS